MFYDRSTISILGEGGFGRRSIHIARADRKPCPVCGHPTGDCTGDDHEEPNIDFAPFAPESKNMIRVQEDVVEEVWITPVTKTRIVRAAKGTYVTVERAKELGIL